MPRLRIRCRCDSHKWVGHPGYDENNGCGAQTPQKTNRPATPNPDSRKNQVPPETPTPLRPDSSTSMPGTFPGSSLSSNFGTSSRRNRSGRRSSRSSPRACNPCPTCGCNGVNPNNGDQYLWAIKVALMVCMLIVLVKSLEICRSRGINPWFCYTPVMIFWVFPMGWGSRLLSMLGY